jgi:hypothetical protein
MRNKRAEKEMHRFDRWMKTRIKSIHYANNEKMSQAYQKVYQNIVALP